MSFELGRKYTKASEIRTGQLLDNDLFDLFDDEDPVVFAGYKYTVKKEYFPKAIVFKNMRDVETRVEVGEHFVDHDGVLESMTDDQVDSYMVPLFDESNILATGLDNDLLATFVEAFNTVYRKTDHFYMAYEGNGSVSLSSNLSTGLFDVASDISNVSKTNSFEDLHDAMIAFLMTSMLTKQ